MEIFQSATSSTAKKTLCCATSSHFYTFCTFPIHIAILMLINSYLNKLTMPCTHNGNKKADAACVAVKTRLWQGYFPRRCSFLTTSCHLSVKDRPQPLPAHPRRAAALPRTSSKSRQGSALCFRIWTASKQLAALPMEKQPYWNMDNTFNPWIGVLSQLPDINPWAEQNKATASWNLQCMPPAHYSLAPELIWV